MPEDKVVFASEPIPGNENNVYAAIDTIGRTGANVTYSDLDPSVHVSGHSSAIEQKILIALTTPRTVSPIGGTYHHMVQYRQLARSMGYKDKNILLLENGQILGINKQGTFIDGTVDLKNVMVDGLGIGDVGTVVLRDRQRMSEDGILIPIIPIEAQTSHVRGEIEVITRGFVYMKESEELIDQIKQETINSIKSFEGYVTDWQAMRHKIEKSLEKMIFKTTQRHPLIMPVIIEV
jgi:ribonuclease J